MPRLVIRQGDAAGLDHALGGSCVVGRHPTVDWVVDDTLLSRRHFCVRQEAGAWIVEDLGSTNGTAVNGQRVEQQALVDGDRIRAGGTEFEFVQKDLLGGAGSRKARRGAAPVARRRRR